jgi:hypothetical protein
VETLVEEQARKHEQQMQNLNRMQEFVVKRDEEWRMRQQAEMAAREKKKAEEDEKIAVQKKIQEEKVIREKATQTKLAEEDELKRRDVAKRLEEASREVYVTNHDDSAWNHVPMLQTVNLRAHFDPSGDSTWRQAAIQGCLLWQAPIAASVSSFYSTLKLKGWKPLWLRGNRECPVLSYTASKSPQVEIFCL